MRQFSLSETAPHPHRGSVAQNEMTYILDIRVKAPRPFLVKNKTAHLIIRGIVFGSRSFFASKRAHFPLPLFWVRFPAVPCLQTLDGEGCAQAGQLSGSSALSVEGSALYPQRIIFVTLERTQGGGLRCLAYDRLNRTTYLSMITEPHFASLKYEATRHLCGEDPVQSTLLPLEETRLGAGRGHRAVVPYMVSSFDHFFPVSLLTSLLLSFSGRGGDAQTL